MHLVKGFDVAVCPKMSMRMRRYRSFLSSMLHASFDL